MFFIPSDPGYIKPTKPDFSMPALAAAIERSIECLSRLDVMIKKWIRLAFDPSTTRKRLDGTLDTNPSVAEIRSYLHDLRVLLMATDMRAKRLKFRTNTSPLVALATDVMDITHLKTLKGRAKEARCCLDELDSEMTVSQELGAAENPAARFPKRRNRQSAKPRTVTAAQAEAVQMVGECKGSLAEAARRLGKNRKTVEQHYIAGLRNANICAAVLDQKPKKRNLPHDKRGQAIVTDD